MARDSGPATLLNDVRELVGQQTLTGTRRRVVGAGREVHAGAGGERIGGDLPRQVALAVHTDIGERHAEAVLHPPQRPLPQRRAATGPLDAARQLATDRAPAIPTSGPRRPSGWP